jgi:mannose-6-phosphate isomerase-like protein (cupin superfamily)
MDGDTLGITVHGSVEIFEEGDPGVDRVEPVWTEIYGSSPFSWGDGVAFGDRADVDVGLCVPSGGLPRMSAPERVIVVSPGEGYRVGNVEFLARSEHTPRFNFALITIEPHRSGPPAHAHEAEDDSFYILEGELTFLVEGEGVVAGPGTFVLVPPGVVHTFANHGNAAVRMLNMHAPAGFDLRLEAD